MTELATDLAPLMADLPIAKKLLAFDSFEPALEMTDLAQLLLPVPQNEAVLLLKLTHSGGREPVPGTSSC